MDMDSLATCNICMDLYDDDVRPRSLNCGHSFCTSCLNNFIAERTLVCPHCQQSHYVSDANNLPINYALEQMIASMREIQLPVAPSHQSGATGKKEQPTEQKEKLKDQKPSSQSGTINRKLLSFIQEQKDNTQSLLHESKEMQSNLHQYKNFLFERKEKHEDLFRKLANLNNEIVQKIDTEYKKVNEIQMEGETLENVINVKLGNLDAITTPQSAIAAIDEHDESSLAIEEWNKKCQQIPDADTITCSEKVVRETTAALSKLISEEDEAAPKSLDLSQSSLPIMDKLCMIRGQPTLNLTCLQSMSKSLKNILEKSHVYAVQIQDGRIRSAKVTTKENIICLHSLQDGEPPIHAQTIKQSDLIGTLKSDSIEVFMDLAWKGSIQGRIHIHISSGTTLGRNFKILCSGDLGPSYAHSRFLQVVLKGDAFCEYVIGGDYEHNDGSGGASLIRGINLNEEIYKRKVETGIVWASYDENDGPKIAQFSILTGKGNDAEYTRVFGKVQKGLDVVRAAVEQDDFSSVTIADCGVVLPL